MPWWLSIVFYGLRAVGWVIGIPGMIARWQAKRQGRADQKASDDAATLKEAQDAVKIEGLVDRLSHAELVAGLHEFSRPDN